MTFRFKKPTNVNFYLDDGSMFSISIHPDSLISIPKKYVDHLELIEVNVFDTVVSKPSDK